VVDASVLDLYAGTGALAIEALSRGAREATLVERDRSALEAINTNIDTLGLRDQTRVITGDVSRFVGGLLPGSAPFDLVLADPPYDLPAADAAAVLAALAAPGWCAPDAIVSLERPHRHPVDPPDGWRTGWERVFGDTLIAFYWR
jgi:16S rRNA (guanine966-N2)-methyltransferase